MNFFASDRLRIIHDDTLRVTTTTPAPKEADIHEHWDFEIRKDGYTRKDEWMK